MNVQEFIDELSRRLRDVKKKQWDDEFLVSALNASLRALTITMPESHTVNRTLTLIPGVEQKIDTDLHRIVSLLHNEAADGSVGRAITKADMSVLDAAYPQWRQDPPRSYIRHWMIDEFDESTFYVWPPAATSRGPEPDIPAQPADPGPLNLDGSPVEFDVTNDDDYWGEVGDRIIMTYGDSAGEITVSTNTGGGQFYRGEIVANAVARKNSGRYVWRTQTAGNVNGGSRTGIIDTSLLPLDDAYVPGSDSGSYSYSHENVEVNHDGAVVATLPSNSDYRTHLLDLDTGTYTIDGVEVGTGLNGRTWVPFAGVGRNQIVGVNTIVRFQFQPVAMLGYRTFIEDSIVTQADIDTYDATLATIQAAVAAHDAWETALINHQVRGTFTATPHVSADEPSDSTVEPSLYTSTVPLNAAYLEPLMEYAMYYAYSVDDDLTANSGRAQRHWLAFFQMLNKKEDAKLMVGEAREITE